MTGDFTILVGSIGTGCWRSTDGGSSFTTVRGGIDREAFVRGFTVDPHDPRRVLAGSGYPSYGLFETKDATEGGFKRVESFPEIEVWRIAFDPLDSLRYFVGTRPAGIWRTEDGGKTFGKLDVEMAATCPAVGIPRVTSILVHPTDPAVVFATVEVDGVRRSLDGGDSWEVVMDHLVEPFQNGNVYGETGWIDCHFSSISVGDPDLVLVATPDGVYRSDDLGASWSPFPVHQSFPQQYHREMQVKLDDPDTIMQGTGEWVTGQEGRLQITRDRGTTWTTADLPDECNSPVWCFAAHPSNPERILASTHKGMVFGTDDAGRTWEKFRREFSEVRALCWVPNA